MLAKKLKYILGKFLKILSKKIFSKTIIIELIFIFQNFSLTSVINIIFPFKTITDEIFTSFEKIYIKFDIGKNSFSWKNILCWIKFSYSEK